jgi:hypothetical protein
MLDSPLTETLIRLTTRIDLPHNRAILCRGLPDRTKNESAMTSVPATSVAKQTQIVMYRVRIISTPPHPAGSFLQQTDLRCEGQVARVGF